MLAKKWALKFVLFLAVFPWHVEIFSQSGVEDWDKYSLEALLNTEISSAAKYKQKTKNVAASVTIITSTDIERYGYTKIDEVFRSIQGFYNSYDRNYSYIGVRGFGRPTDFNNRILMLVNGVAINDNFYGAAGAGYEQGIDFQAIERIEIVRGPGSALYGSHAMFAVVNIVLKKAINFDGAQIRINSGSYGRRGQSAIFGKEFSNGAGLIISGNINEVKGQNHYYPEFDNPATNNGIAANLDWEKYYQVASVLSYGELSINFLYNQRKKGVPTASYETAFNYPGTKTRDSWGLFSIKYNHSIRPDTRLVLTAGYNHFSYFGVWPYEWEESDQQNNIFESYDSNLGKWLNGEIQLIHDFNSGNRFTAGAEYRNNMRADYKIWDEEITYFQIDRPYFSFSGYMQDEHQITESSAFTAGVRYDHSSTGWNAISPRAGFVHHIFDKTTVKLLYGEAFRAPSLYEIYYEDRNAGFKRSVDLQPEKIRTFEFNFEQQLTANIYGILSTYNNRIRDLIEPTVDPVDEQIQNSNVHDAQASGIELSLNLRHASMKSSFFSYSLQSAKEGALSKNMSNSPSHILKAGMVLPLFDKFFLATQFLYETGRLTVKETETINPVETDPYLLADMAITSKLLRKHFKLSFKIRNILNQEYAFPGGFEHDMNSIRQDGRNYRIALSFVH